MQPPWWCHMHHPPSRLRSLEARLKNPNATFFQVKQATRSRRVSRTILPPLVLWRNRQIKASMILRPKPRNRRGDFETQITKLELPVLRPKQWNLSHRFWGPTGENRTSGFDVKPLPNCRPWFWGSTKKHALPIFMCTIQTAHGITWPPDHPTTEYPTYATILGPLHLVSYSCHDPHRCPPCRTCHLHTTRQTNMILHMKQRIKIKQWTILDLNSNLTKSMTHHNQTKELTT
jgi:hypothetical protein